jgi:hypothetical protein
VTRERIVRVDRRGIDIDGVARGWNPFDRERDPLAAAARAFVGARNPRLPRLSRASTAALVAAHLALDGALAPHMLVVAVADGAADADRAYWKTARPREGREASPILFAATLPSAVAGELAMTFGLGGPCLVFAGRDARDVLDQDQEMLDAVAERRSRLEVHLAGWEDDEDGEAVATLRHAHRQRQG